MIVIRRDKGCLLLPVRVTPKGSTNAVMPWREGDDRLQVKVSVPPEGGQANKALIEVLAKTLGLPKRAITLAGGATSRLKIIALACDEAVIHRLAEAVSADDPEKTFRLEPPA